MPEAPVRAGPTRFHPEIKSCHSLLIQKHQKDALQMYWMEPIPLTPPMMTGMGIVAQLT